jgi:hypothetical protein
MALTLSSTLKPSNSTDALFRAWSQFIRDGFVAGGWVQTADTGQINFGTASAPTGTNEKVGYVVLRMNDALQETHPVFVRIDFGSGGAANNVSIWITVGPGSSGSGSITSAWITDRRSLEVSSAATGIHYSHVSAGTNYAAVALFYSDVSSTLAIHFAMERAKTSGGAEDGTGFILNGTGSGTHMNQFATVYDGTTHLATGSPFVISTDTQNRRSDVGIGVVLPYRRVSGFERAAPPPLGHILLKISDWNFGAVVTVHMYGQPHKYIRLGNNSLAVVRGDTPSTHAVAVRYDD